MSTAAGIGATGSAAHEPRWVREGSSSVQSAYREGAAFEEVLLSQLTRTMFEAGSGSEGEGGEGQAGQLGPLASMLPQALAEGVAQQGGLGLAEQLARQAAAFAPAGSHARGASPAAPAGTPATPEATGAVDGGLSGGTAA